MQPTPKMDYFLGYPVTKVADVRQAGDVEGWYIQFENGGKVSNFDGRYKLPMLIVGLKLSTIKEFGDEGRAELTFGTDDNPDMEKVTMNLNKFGVAHPRLHGGQMVGPMHPLAGEEEIVSDEADPRIVTEADVQAAVSPQDAEIAPEKGK